MLTFDITPFYALICVFVHLISVEECRANIVSGIKNNNTHTHTCLCNVIATTTKNITLHSDRYENVLKEWKLVKLTAICLYPLNSYYLLFMEIDDVRCARNGITTHTAAKWLIVITSNKVGVLSKTKTTTTITTPKWKRMRHDTQSQDRVPYQRIIVLYYHFIFFLFFFSFAALSVLLLGVPWYSAAATIRVNNDWMKTSIHKP